MDKTSKKVTKDPKRVDAARKGREKYMNKLKESIPNDAKKGDGDTTNVSNETTSHTTNTSSETTGATNTASTHATGSNDTYVYGVGILALYFLHITLLRLKIKNKPMIARRISMSKNNHQNDVICFRKIYIING